MAILIILLTALLPVGILAFYIYRKDKNSPEPTSQLLKAFFYGMLSIPVSLCISVPLGMFGFYPAHPETIWGSISTAFFAAAVPEEIAKFVMLWLFLRKNTYFDEKMDGIVYAVCISLGFAAVENILYLFSNAESFLAVGMSRAIFSIPGHFCFGVLMGYYYSLYRFYPKAQSRNKALVLIAPIVAHGVYDAILFMTDVTPAISGVLSLIFLIFCYQMWKYGSKSIKEHLARDNW